MSNSFLPLSVRAKFERGECRCIARLSPSLTTQLPITILAHSSLTDNCRKRLAFPAVPTNYNTHDITSTKLTAVTRRIQYIT